MDKTVRTRVGVCGALPPFFHYRKDSHMKRTLITTGVAALLATLGVAAYAHVEGQHNQKNCTQADGKACPADGKGAHQHDGKGGMMQGRMQGMQGKHGSMEKNHAQMAEMHARMHGAAGTPDKDGKEGEHKH